MFNFVTTMAGDVTGVPIRHLHYDASKGTWTVWSEKPWSDTAYGRAMFSVRGSGPTIESALLNLVQRYREAVPAGWEGTAERP